MGVSEFAPELKPVTSFGEHCFTQGEHADSREEWLAARRELITASDFAAIMGEDPYRSALDVFADKTLGRIDDGKLSLDDPRFWGIHLERHILQIVAEHHGWAYQPGGHLLRSRRHPFVGATLDAEVNRGEGWWVYEGKTTRITKGWDEDTGELPTRVLIQTQAQLLVTGAPGTVVFALLQGSRPCTIVVEPSPKFHAVLVEVADEFRERIRTLDPPKADARSASALSRLHPRDKAAGGVQLSFEAMGWTQEYQQINEQLRALEGRKKELQNMLKQSIGDRVVGVLPEPVNGQRCWRWSTQERAAYSVEASTIEVLRTLKWPPPDLFNRELSPAPNPHLQLTEALEASVNSHTQPINTKRRRAPR